MPALRNLLGQRFGRLVVLGRGGATKSGRGVRWQCRCDCGAEKTAASADLLCGDTTSCGCYYRSLASSRTRTHGMSKTPIYKAWAGVVARTTNPKHKDWKYYGGRGIKICERWLVFENFYADMGDRPDGKTLDRRDNNKGYEAGNCRWATRGEQVNNRRGNVLVQHDGKTKTVAELSKETGVKYDTLHQRITSGQKIPHTRRT